MVLGDGNLTRTEPAPEARGMLQTDQETLRYGWQVALDPTCKGVATCSLLYHMAGPCHRKRMQKSKAGAKMSRYHACSRVVISFNSF